MQDFRGVSRNGTTEGQPNDHVGARTLFGAVPKAKVLIADSGHESKAFIQALERRGIEACIPPRRNRKVPVSCDRNLYKNRHKIEDLFAKLKDWRRNAMRYDRYPRTFFQAICIAAAVSSCLKQ